MSKDPHLEYDALCDYAEGRLARDAGESVATHLSACARCAGQLVELKKLMRLMRTDRTEDAPRAARMAASRLFQSRAIPREPVLRRVLAALKFDSLQPEFAMGLRASATAERQLVFEAGANELHLQIAADGESWRITGQVIGPCTGGEVELEGGGGQVRATLDELCEFELPAQPAGVYALTLHLGESDLAIPELTLG